MSLLRRTFALSFSRFANQAIAILSPILLVRLLSVEQYGSYREFLLYAAVIAPLVLFGIPNSLIYFVPRYPDKERVWVTQTMLVTLAATVIAIAILFVAGDLVRVYASFDFVIALQVYLFFFINLDFVEYDWLARKRIDYVLAYSLARLAARLTAVVVAAWLTGDVWTIIYALTGIEILRFLVILALSLKHRWFSRGFGLSSLRLQASYFLPLGLGGAVESLNMHIGLLFVSIAVGVEALALYVIGAFVLQVLHVLRGAIADVIFPEIVGLRRATPREMLPLWQRATIWYGVMLFPMGLLLSYYADAVITILFTSAYTAAIPVFAILSLMLYVDCFDFHLPLRAQNANRYYVQGNAIAALVNMASIYPLYSLFGLIGPAIALVLSRLAFTTYLAVHTIKLYKVKTAQILPWISLGKILAVSVLCTVVLIAGKALSENYMVRSVVFGTVYLMSVLLLLRWAGVWDFWPVVQQIFQALNRRGGHATHGSP